MSRPCCVYRVWDYGGTLLYVGSSIDPEGRMRGHEFNSPWWPFKDHVTHEWFPSEAEGRAAEKVAIGTEHPRWNVIGRAADHPDGRVSQTWGRFAAPHLREEIELWRDWNRAYFAKQRADNAFSRLQERVQEIAMWRSPTLLTPRQRKEESLRQLREEKSA